MTDGRQASAHSSRPRGAGPRRVLANDVVARHRPRRPAMPMRIRKDVRDATRPCHGRSRHRFSAGQLWRLGILRPPRPAGRAGPYIHTVLADVHACWKRWGRAMLARARATSPGRRHSQHRRCDRIGKRGSRCIPLEVGTQRRARRRPGCARPWPAAGWPRMARCAFLGHLGAECPRHAESRWAAAAGERESAFTASCSSDGPACSGRGTRRGEGAGLAATVSSSASRRFCVSIVATSRNARAAPSRRCAEKVDVAGRDMGRGGEQPERAEDVQLHVGDEKLRAFPVETPAPHRSGPPAARTRSRPVRGEETHDHERHGDRRSEQRCRTAPLGGSPLAESLHHGRDLMLRPAHHRRASRRSSMALRGARALEERGIDALRAAFQRASTPVSRESRDLLRARMRPRPSSAASASDALDAAPAARASAAAGAPCSARKAIGDRSPNEHVRRASRNAVHASWAAASGRLCTKRISSDVEPWPYRVARLRRRVLLPAMKSSARGAASSAATASARRMRRSGRRIQSPASMSQRFVAAPEARGGSSATRGAQATGQSSAP